METEVQYVQFKAWLCTRVNAEHTSKSKITFNEKRQSITLKRIKQN